MLGHRRRIYSLYKPQESSEYMSKFLQGTIILIIAGLITRVLGFVNRIVVARMIGDEGVGLYMMAVPTLVLVITLTQLGLPVAISKLVAEAEALGDRHKIKNTCRLSKHYVYAERFIYARTNIIRSRCSKNLLYRFTYNLSAACDYSSYSNHRCLVCHPRIFSRKAANEACCLFSNY